MMYGYRHCFTGATPQSMQTMNGYVDKAKSYPDQSLVASFLDVRQNYFSTLILMPEPRSIPLQLARV